MALLERLQILIDADGKGAVREFQKVGATADREMSKADERIRKVSSGLTTFGSVAVAGGTAAAVGLGAFAMAAADAETQQLKLTNAIKNSSNKFSDNGQALRDQASDLQKVTAAEDDATAAAQAYLVQMGLTQDEVLKLTPLLVDLSRKQGVDLETAARAAVKGIDGQAKGLRTLGVDVDNATLKAGGFTAVLDGIRKSAGGFAEDEGKTFSGQLAIIKNQLGEVEEGLGKGVVSVVKPIGELGGKLAEVNPAILETAGAIGAVAAGGSILVGGLSFVAGQALKVRDVLTLVGDDGSRSLNKAGKAATALGGVLATIAVTDIVFNFVNDSADIKGQTKAAIDDLTIARDELDKAAGAAAFARQAEIEANTLRFANLFGRELGAEIDLGDGIKTDIENAQAALDSLDPKNARFALESLQEYTNTLDPNSDQFKTNTEFIETNRAALDKHAKASKVDAEAVGEVADATEEATLKIKDYGTALDFVKATQDITAAGASGFAEAIKASSGGLNDNLDAAQGVGSAFKDLGEIIGMLPARYDLGAAAAGKYTDEQNKALDTFQAAGAAVQTQLETLLATGASYEQITLAAAGYEAQLRKQLEQVGITGEAQDEYIRLLGLTPEQVSTAIQLSGMEQARAQLAFLQGDLYNLPEEVQSNIYAKVAQNDWTGALELYKQFKDKQVNVTIKPAYDLADFKLFGGTGQPGVSRVPKWIQPLLGRASGGQIPGTGNGDTVPAMLTPGEYVIRKDAAAAIGLPMLERLNKADKSVIADMGAQAQRFANGGMVKASPVAPQVYRPTMTYVDAGDGAVAASAQAQSGGNVFNIESITTNSVEELPAEMSRSALRLKALLG